MSAMLMKSARRSVAIGTRSGDFRRCNCWDCATTKSKGAQRMLERRQWQAEADK